jgi:hypothetical protein
VPQQLLVLTSGTKTTLTAHVDVPALPDVPVPIPANGNAGYKLPVVLTIRDRNGTAISQHRADIEAKADPTTGKIAAGPRDATVEISADETTKAALLLAGRPGTWELSVCGDCGTPACPSAGDLVAHGEARSSYVPTAPRRVPVGCSDCGKKDDAVQPWSAGLRYRPGDIVEFHGVKYAAACDIPPGQSPPGQSPPRTGWGKKRKAH